VQNTQGRLRFWTEVAVYLENGRRQARSCHGTLTGSHRWRIDTCRFRWPWVLEWPLTRVSKSWYTYNRISEERCVLGTKLTIGKPYAIYRMVPLSITLMTLDRDFKVAILFNIEYPRNDMRQRHSYYRTSIGSHTRAIEWWHFQWPWRTPNPVFKVTAYLKSTISKTVRLTDLLQHTSRKPYLTYRMYHVWWPWLASKRVTGVCQHQLSFLLIPSIGNF